MSYQAKQIKPKAYSLDLSNLKKYLEGKIQEVFTKLNDLQLNFEL